MPERSTTSEKNTTIKCGESSKEEQVRPAGDGREHTCRETWVFKKPKLAMKLYLDQDAEKYSPLRRCSTSVLEKRNDKPNLR